jgi:hypothetical protein
MALFKHGLGLTALCMVMACGAAAQQAPVSNAPKAPVANQAPSELAKKRQPDPTHKMDISRDPDRSAIGPRTTQGLAQDAINRSSGR